ncbi:Neuronal acetylcholine receptor subunit alpha-10 [Holothuria leucospilota]|uniref:Neuronal acetylcholine receptor subunit alpha-10 n=1 Tax=Holothuria leucospilota TaxID=206669 RepID=A0A9Q0YTH0_HOLLE|nr:Neuronal acetylcholine receptor subunit alpha-10 [Holothuria leucospilota]
MDIIKVLATLLIVLGSKLFCQCDKHYRRLLDDLFAENNYSKLVRPVKNHSHIVQIEMLFYLARVIKLDERMQTLQTNAWLTLMWTDEYLQWDPNDYNGIDNFKIPSDMLWMPDVVLYNNADEYKDYLNGKIVVVNHTGEIMWASPEIFITSCIIDVTNFPFDEQECCMKFGPWQYEGKEVKVTGGGEWDETVFQSDGQWDITDISDKSSQVMYPDAPGKLYTDVTYSIRFRRRPYYYVFNMILPCGFVSLVALLTFFLPPESGEKIGLGITVLLSLTVFLLLVAETMPPTSAVPVVGKFFMSTMALICSSLALSVAVLNLHYAEPDCLPVPWWVRKYILGILGPTLFPFRQVKKRRDYMSHKVSIKSDVYLWDVEELMNINETSMQNNTVNQNGCTCVGSDQVSKDETTNHTSHIKDSTSSSRSDVFLRELLKETKKMTSSYEKKREDKHKQAEWRRVALVMDRLFLILFLLCSLITFFVMIRRLKTPDVKYRESRCFEVEK